MNRRRMVIAGVVAVVVVGVAVTAYAVTSSGTSAADRYRTTTATRGDLTATVSLSGSLTHVDAVTAAFPTSGVVTSVSVHAGQQVKAGDVLATMDTTPLRAALLEAQSQVAAAQLAIEQDRTTMNSATPSATPQAGSGGQGTGTSGAGATAARPSGISAGGTGSAGATGTAASLAEVTKALAAVDDAQKAVNASCQGFLSGLGQGTDPSGQGRSAAPVAEQSAPSASPEGTASATPSATASPSPTPSTSPPSSTSASPSPTAQTVDPKALETCMKDLSALSAAQHRAALSLDAGATALTRQTQNQQSAAAGATGSTSVPSAAARTGATTGQSGQSGQSGQTGQAGSGSMTPQARLLADQGTLAVAQQQQTQAQNNLDAATLSAPISGVVGAVDVSVGNRATPTKGIVIIGPGAAQVDATASLADLQQIAVGDDVQVRTVGSSTMLDGTLTAVGALPSSGAGTDAPSYPVVVTVPSGAGGLPEGAPSTASIVTTSLNGVLVIPSSALTTTATGATQVTTLAGGSTRTVDVSVGARGQGRVQILSGAGPSDTIVLADLTAPLPSTNLNNARQAFGGSGSSNGNRSAAPSGSSSPR